MVAVYDLDPATKPEESVPITDALAPPPENIACGDALCTVLTGPHGTFQLTFEDAQFRIRNPDERRPDLVLQVLAPEEPGATRESRLLYVSRTVRQNAGRTEQYLIRL